MPLSGAKLLCAVGVTVLVFGCRGRLPADVYRPIPGAPSWPLPAFDDSTAVKSDTAEIRLWSEVSIAVPRGPLIRLLQYQGRTWGEYYMRYPAVPMSVGDDSDGVPWDSIARADRQRVADQYGCRDFAVVENEGVCRVPFRRGQPDWGRLWARMNSIGDSVHAVGPPDNPLVPRERTRGDTVHMRSVVCLDGSGMIMERRQAGTAAIDRPPLWVCERGGARATERKRLESALWELLERVDSVALGRLPAAGAP